MDELSLEARAAEGDNNLTPTVSADASSALDALAAEIHNEQTEGTPAPKADEAPATETPATETPATETPATETPATETPAGDQPTKVDDAKPKTEEKPAAKADAPKEDFETVELPPHSRPKTSEAFALVKEKARVAVEGLRKQAEADKSAIAELTTKLDAASKAQGQLTPEVQAELEDLRKFKLSHDVESDPAFKQFANEVETNRQSVIKKLKEIGANDETIGQINTIGFDNVDWDKFLGTIKNLQARRYIEAKLVENEGLKEKKEQALEKAKTNAKEFLSEREGRTTKAMNDAAAGFIQKFGFGAQREIPANAKPEEKAAIEAANKASKDHADLIQSMLGKYSPEAYAETVVGTALAYRYAADNKALIAARAEDAKKIESVTAERDALQKKLDGIKSASAVRRPGEIRPAAPAKKPTINTDGASALDELAKQIQAEQNEQ